MRTSKPVKPSAIAYVRVSTGKQVEEGVSLDAQEERIRAYCKMKGLKLAQIVREEGISASKALGDRPEGKRVLDALAGKQAEHIVALKLDRLFRDAADALTQTRRWDKAGVALHLIDFGGTAIDTSSAMGRMFLTMAAGFAELERNLIAERTTSALGFKKRSGQVYCANTPLGYSRTRDGRLVPNGPEQIIIRRIHAMRQADSSLHEIAAVLNKAGHRGRKGGKFYASSIKKILENSLHG